MKSKIMVILLTVLIFTSWGILFSYANTNSNLESINSENTLKEINDLKSKISSIEEKIETENGITEKANLVYLLDQFYSNAWNKLIICFTAVGFIVGVVVPLYIEHLRNNRNIKLVEEYKTALDEQNLKVKEMLEKFKSDTVEAKTNEVINKMNELEIKFNVIDSDNERIINRIKEDNLKRQKEMIELIKDQLINVTLDEDAVENIENGLILLERDIERTEEINNEKLPFLHITINGKIIYGNTVREFYDKVFSYLIENVQNFKQYSDYNTGKIRRLIYTKNEHLNGEKFTHPLKVGDFYIETHKSKEGALKDLRKYLEIIQGIELE